MTTTTATLTQYELRRAYLGMKRLLTTHAANVLKNPSGDVFDYADGAYYIARVHFPSVDPSEFAVLIRRVWKEIALANLEF
jgi:hypothetical protein